MTNPIILTKEILIAFPCLEDVGLIEVFYVDGELHTTSNGGVREYGNLLDNWAKDYIHKMNNDLVNVADIVYHKKSGKSFKVKSIRGELTMCYELDSDLERIARTTKNGKTEMLVDRTISYKVSLLKKNGLAVIKKNEKLI